MSRRAQRVEIVEKRCAAKKTKPYKPRGGPERPKRDTYDLVKVSRRHYNHTAPTAYRMAGPRRARRLQNSGTLTKGGPGNGDRSLRLQHRYNSEQTADILLWLDRRSDVDKRAIIASFAVGQGWRLHIYEGAHARLESCTRSGTACEVQWAAKQPNVA
jgi:hypothetical protein